VLRAFHDYTVGAGCANLSSFLPEVTDEHAPGPKSALPAAADGHVYLPQKHRCFRPRHKGGVVVIGHLSSASARNGPRLPVVGLARKSLLVGCGRTGMSLGGPSPAKAERCSTLTDSALNPHLQARRHLLGIGATQHRLCGRRRTGSGQGRPVRASGCHHRPGLDETARTGGGGEGAGGRRDPGGELRHVAHAAVSMPCAASPAPTPFARVWHEPCAGIARAATRREPEPPRTARIVNKTWSSRD